MEIVRAKDEMREHSRRLRREGRTIGFVPTMGALHEGHLSLVRRARSETDAVVVSIFVNPLQFGPGEDYERYPRDLEGDARMLEEEGADFVFTAEAEQMYAEDHSTYVVEEDLALPLEGTFRPTHFRGVLTVVMKLFQIVQPDVAYFGRKDAQQALLVQRMVRDLDVPVRIDVLPIVREPDGLALSSRNAYLDAQERERALALSRGLAEARGAFRRGVRDAAALVRTCRDVIERTPGVSLDYVALRHPETFAPLEGEVEDGLLLVAARVGETRLIDNTRLADDAL